MKLLAKTLWVFLFFTLTITKLCVCIRFCRENEQQALETLKKEFYDPDNIYISWVVGRDCCEWEGIVCHNLTGHVIKVWIFDGNVESSSLRIDNLEWLPSLVNLKHLEMESVDLSKATNWLQVTNKLPSLVELILYKCNLHYIPPLLSLHNFSSLEILDLSWNDINSAPIWAFNLPSLVKLTLSSCNLHYIPPLLDHNFPSLESLDLSSNNFTSPIPKWIFSLSTLVYLGLSYSSFTCPFPEGPINLTSLKTFDLSGNSFNCHLPRWLFDLNNLENFKIHGSKLSGKLPTVIGKLRKLITLDLSNNLFEGEISELFSSTSNCFQIGLENCYSLYFLNLENNKLTGALPRSLGHLSRLHWLSISNNRLEGVVTQSHFTNITQLMYLYAFGNNLTLKVSKSWISSFQANSIAIGGWNLGPQFPIWVQTQKSIGLLDISVE